MQELIRRIKLKKYYLGVILFAFLVVSLPSLVAAQGLDSWREKLNKGAEVAHVNTDIKSPEPIIETIIMALLSFLGVIFLILMIYGGFLWMTARGNEDQVTKSKNLIIAAVIGLIIVMASYAISFFILEPLTDVTMDF